MDIIMYIDNIIKPANQWKYKAPCQMYFEKNLAAKYFFENVLMEVAALNLY